MRKQNWQSILIEKIEEQKNVPFVWGVSDCLIFPTQAAEAILDRSPYEDFQREKYQYDSEEGSLKILADNFGGCMHGVLSLFFKEVPLGYAGRGDIAIVSVAGKEICGIIDTSGRRVACKSFHGILFAPISKAIKAWRVE